MSSEVEKLNKIINSENVSIEVKEAAKKRLESLDKIVKK